MIAMYVAVNQYDWDLMVPYCVFAYNTSRHEQNKFSPYYLLFGRHATLPVDAMSRIDSVAYQSSGDYARSIIKNLRIAHELAKANQRDIASAYERKLLGGEPISFKPGDLVMMQFYARKFGSTKKLALMWRGPFEIVKSLGPVTYQIKVPGNSSLLYVTHVNRLKKYYPPTDPDRVDTVEEMKEREELLQEEEGSVDNEPQLFKWLINKKRLQLKRRSLIKSINQWKSRNRKFVWNLWKTKVSNLKWRKNLWIEFDRMERP
jgi:hypothetical protein